MRCVLSLVCVLGLALGCKPLPDCYADSDCSNGLTCVDSQCVQPCTSSADCDGDGECRGVQNAVNGTWRVAPHCQATAACDCRSDTDVCVETDDQRTCVQLQANCTFRSCPSGYECVSTAGESSCVCSGGSCGPTCSSDDQCALGKCTNGRCSHRACESNGDCNNDSVCVVGSNGDGVCERRGTLDIGEVCSSSMQCESGHCTLLGGTGTCQQSCVKDSDCGADGRCARDSTYQAAGGGTCVPSASCGRTLEPSIVDGSVLCSSAERCATDQDCPAPGTCVLEQCTCPAGACEQSCDDDADCDAGLVCLNDACVLPLACETSEDCPNANVCASDPTALPAGKHCMQNGTNPEGASCDSAHECESGLCIDGRCELECETSADCTDGECAQRALNNGGFALLCSSAGCDCKRNEVCLRDGSCTSAKSCLAEACSNGETCVGGVCRTTCTATADCDNDESCTFSDTEAAYFCAVNDCACASDEVCTSGQCVAASACRVDSQCPSGVCLFGQCQTACESEKDCDGRECLATQTNRGTRLLCGTFGCGCASDSWCDPSGLTPACYQGLDCERCGAGYACAPPLPPNYFANDEPLEQACQCESPLDCGKRCERDDECAPGEECSARGRCAPSSVCRTNDDCENDEDCVVARFDLTAENRSAVVGQCQTNACGCTIGEDICVVLGTENACVRPNSECSVLDTSCVKAYRCNAELSLCVCDDPETCGGGCSETADCAPDRVCDGGRCVTRGCQNNDDCPRNTVCGGPTRDRCVQPGSKRDFELCREWFECESAYCFANNACATPCDVAACEGDLVCQLFAPEDFPGERPICLDQPSDCEPACEAQQYCDNAREPSCQPPLEP